MAPPVTSLSNSKPAPRCQRFEPHAGNAELTVPAGLLLVLALDLDRTGERLAIRHPGRFGFDLHTHPFDTRDRHREVGLARAREHGLVGDAVVADRQGRILGDDPAQRHGQPILVRRRLRTDGHSVDRRGQLRRRDGDRQTRRRERVTGGRVLELRHRADVAGAHAADRSMVTPGQRHQLMEPFGLPGARTHQLVVGPDHAGQDLEDRDLAEELVETRLEDQRERITAGVRQHRDGAASGLDLRRPQVTRRRTDPAHQVEQVVGADGRSPRPAEHGKDRARVDRLVQQPLELFGTRLGALEVLLERVVVDLDHLFDQLLVAGALGVGHLVGDRRRPGLAAVVDEGLVGQQVGDAVEARLLANGQLDRVGVGAEVVTNLLEGALEGRVGPVELVHEDHARQPHSLGMAPQHRVLRLNPADAVDHEDGQLGRAHAEQCLAAVVGVSRRVDQVDRVPVPLEDAGGQPERVAPLPLLDVAVAHGRAVTDTPRPVDHAGPVEHGLGQAGLPVARVADQHDVANLLRGHV